MHAVSKIIVIILILMIVVAIASLFWIFSSGLFSSVTQTGTSSISHITEVMSSCMRIESLYQNKIYLRNCGQGLITNDSLNIYIDDVPFSFNMTPSSINANELATIAMPVWGISIGSHNLRITNPNTELIKTVESILPDSCVLSLDFDEGSGTIAHDSSVYHNDGILLPVGSEPLWVQGKFGKALNFDGLNDIVYVQNGGGLNITNTITLEAWVYAKKAQEQYVINKGDYRLGFNSWPNLNFYFVNSSYLDEDYIISLSSQPINKWLHIAATYNRYENKIRLYADGELKKEEGGITGSPIATANNNLNISSFAGQYFFNGTIDSIRIFNKALTPDETVILRIK